MSSTQYNLASERNFIDACDDPAAILDWMRDYASNRRAAEADGDDDAAEGLEDLIEFAEERVVELKTIRVAPPASRAVHRPSTAERWSHQQATPVGPRQADPELHALRERARNAEARLAAAQAETTRIQAEQQRQAKEQERERHRAARHAEALERAAADAEATTKMAAHVKLPAPGLAFARPSPISAVASAAAAPVDVLPPLMGSDLTSFRNWLGVSQRALATKLGVEQSTISKGEGKPAAVLAPGLRRALHVAMSQPREPAGKGS